jgi:hypothetical protein
VSALASKVHVKYFTGFSPFPMFFITKPSSEHNSKHLLDTFDAPEDEYKEELPQILRRMTTNVIRDDNVRSSGEDL